ncbi:SDR family NAD(P)-dependent oxidoreductase, partial [Sphingomonas sp.]|uniref:SDR family NAD(P)-dependent oxidoreductase n=1 Tax=Sphingomonas sp. TaxID=28214 RepID=UPI002DB81759
MRLAGKVAIITGAGSGIGRATARRFAAEGAKLVIGDKSDAVRETADMIGGDSVIAMQMDAGSEADVQQLVATAVDRFGGLDIAYANAGI